MSELSKKIGILLMSFILLFAGAYWIHLHYKRPLPSGRSSITYQQSDTPGHTPFLPREYIRIYPHKTPPATPEKKATKAADS